jgi:O-antigen/teichoic acid export membrane protein
MFTAISLKVQKVAGKALFRNTLWELLAKFFTLSVQAAYFVAVTRTLGTENYGSFIGVSSLAAIAFPFASIGTGDLLVKYVSRNRKLFPFYWGNALLIVLISSFTLTIFLFCLSSFLFRGTIDALAIFMILVADLICLAIFIVSARAFMSVDLFKKSSLLQMLSTANKLIAALLLVIFFPKASLLNWTSLYLGSSIVTAFISIFVVNKLLGNPTPLIPKIKSEINQGVYFSIGESANNINSSIDKTMLASMSTLEATGIYGAAYRFIEVGAVPIYAVLSTAYPKFFQQGVFGIRGCLTLVKQLLPIVGIYGLVAWGGFFLFAPWIPLILGEEYQTAIAALRWLAPIPLIGALQILLADTLTGAGFQKIRSIIQITTAMSNAALNFWLIPAYSWLGATWATLASDSFRVICMFLTVIFLFYQQKRSPLKH